MRTNSRVGGFSRMVRLVRRRWTQEVRQGFAHAAHFSGDVMKAPRRSPRSLISPSFIEELEARQMLAATLSSAGVLTVAGTNRADNIRIISRGSSVVVKLNGTSKTFARSAVKELIVNGNNGNDKINVVGPIPNVTLNG